MNQERIRQLAGIGYVNLATLAWASNMVIGRLVRDDIGPITLSASRFTVAAVFFLILLQQTPKIGRPTRAALPLLAGMALSGVILFSPLLYLGLHFTTAVNGTLINGTGPLLTGLLAALLIREPMKGRQIGGALLALAGVVWLISGGSFAFWQQAGYNVGDLLVLTAVATWGVYSILSGRVMRLMPAVAATAWSIFLGLPVLWLLAAWELYTSPIEMSFKLAMIVFYLGLGCGDRVLCLEPRGGPVGGKRRDGLLQHVAVVRGDARGLIAWRTDRTSASRRRSVDHWRRTLGVAQAVKACAPG